MSCSQTRCDAAGLARAQMRWMLLAAAAEVVLLAGCVRADTFLARYDDSRLPGPILLARYAAVLWIPTAAIYWAVASLLCYQVDCRLVRRFDPAAEAGAMRGAMVWSLKRLARCVGLVLCVLVTRALVGEYWPVPAGGVVLAYHFLSVWVGRLGHDPTGETWHGRPGHDSTGGTPVLLAEFARSRGIEDIEVRLLPAGCAVSEGRALYLEFAGKGAVYLDRSLVESLTGDELVAVFAHELAHRRLGHVRASLWGRAATLVLIVWSAWPVLHFFAPKPAAAHQAIHTVAAVLLAAWVARTLLRPMQLALARRQERQAHEWALDATADAGVFLSAMRKLAADGSGGRPPAWWQRAFFQTHPTLEQVVRQARRWEANNL